MIPLVAHDLAVAYAAGVAFTFGALTPFVVVGTVVRLLWKPRK